MLTVLLRSQTDVKKQLFERVEAGPRPVVVAQEHELGMGGPFEKRLPWRHLLEHKAKVTMIAVADDANEGLWRDPVGELADKNFPTRRDAALATAGYQLFLPNGEVVYLKRDLWDPWADVRAIVNTLGLRVPLPERVKAEASKPRVRRVRDDLSQDDVDTEPGDERGQRQRILNHEPPPPRSRARAETVGSPPTGRPAEPTPVPEKPQDPFLVLGVAREIDEEGLKKAFRALIVQYHPDKVSHLAPEFQELAERKSRELTVAYEAAQRVLRGEPPLDG